jgi:ATP-dependent DNA helicase RecQ
MPYFYAVPTPADILKQYWGYDVFRPLQEEIVQSVLDGKDTLALMPTGGGKSICFQVPALVKEGICIVVSPLIALMQDQVNNLVKRGINAVTVNATMSYREIDIVLDNCIYGNIKFLYLSPERLGTELVRERIKKMKVNLVAVDEAHCISQWGNDFRPSYLKIADIRELIPKTPILALTASATAETVDDIQKKLLFKQKNAISKSFARENLAYIVRYEDSKLAKLMEICHNVKGSGIVYVRNRRATKDIADYLRRQNINAAFYHAGLEIAARNLQQNDWLQNRVRVIVCTNAFGMGIDKPDVRFVVHLDVPDSPEAYFQEAGRAGRDGEKAYAVLLYGSNDGEDAEKRYEKAFPPIEEIKRVYKALSSYYFIAEGSAMGQAFEFDIQHFCSYYKFEALLVFNSLKLLEKEGYLELTEALYKPSRVFITINHADLYNYQVQNPKMDAFIRTLLRLYGGMFEQYVNINERSIAQGAKLREEQVIYNLELLKKQEVLDYVKATDKPQIIFTMPYATEKQLRMSEDMYWKLKASYEKRMKALLYYATIKTRCRNVMLLEYFGETDATECGVCDYCIAKKARPKSELTELTHNVLRVIEKHNPLPDQVLKHLEGADGDMLKEVLRALLDDGHIFVTPEGRLSLTVS